MVLLLQVAGAVALLLLGVRYLRKGLDRLFGQRLSAWMRRVGSKRGLAFVTGVAAAVLAPSSTTMSLLAVQTVQSGHMNARQMLAVMLGANVGLTILVQLVALRLDAFAPLFLVVGYLMFQYARNSRPRGIGQVILALGFFFLAMSVIKTGVAAAHIGPESDLAKLIAIAERHPVALAVLAAVMATLLQSATATIGVVIGLGASGVTGMPVAIPVVIGANVGLAITTLIVGWQQVESRRLGAANLLLKLVVAAAGIIALPWLIDALRDLPGPFSWHVANLHTAFNLAQAIIGLPAAGLIATLLERVIPAPPLSERTVFGPKFIHNGPIDSIALATGQSLREIMHMSEIVRSMLQDVWLAMKSEDERLAREVSQRDDKVDLLDHEIKRFLTRLANDEITQSDADEQMRQLQYLTELETVGDIVDKNISELVLKKIRLRARFTPEGASELDDFFRKVCENQIIADAAFTTRDATLAQTLLRHKEKLNEYEQELRDRHFGRLKAGLVEAHETSAIHLDLLTHLKRINSSVSHVAFPILQNGAPPRRTSSHSAPAGDNSRPMDAAI